MLRPLISQIRYKIPHSHNSPTHRINSYIRIQLPNSDLPKRKTWQMSFIPSTTATSIGMRNSSTRSTWEWKPLIPALKERSLRPRLTWKRRVLGSVGSFKSNASCVKRFTRKPFPLRICTKRSKHLRTSWRTLNPVTMRLFLNANH